MQDSSIKIIEHSERVEALLDPFKDIIGDDFKAYRGHVYRVLTYAMHFVDHDEEVRPIMETALVYHDIGLWAGSTLSYLEPSEKRALEDNKKNRWGFDPDALYAVIHWHHKILPYKGSHARLVEAARRADWIDATGGVRRMGLSEAQIKTVEEAIPNFNFSGVLQRICMTESMVS